MRNYLIKLNVFQVRFVGGLKQGSTVKSVLTHRKIPRKYGPMRQTLGHIDPKKVTHLDYVRGLLAMHRITNVAIGEMIGVSHTTVSHVLSGRRKSRRILQAVADALNMTFEELWGKQQ